MTIDIKQPKLVLSLPPFDQFGMAATLADQGVHYILLEQAILELVNTAEKTLEISAPFFDIHTIPKIRQALLKKAYDGVKIKILAREVFREDDDTRRVSIIDFLREAKQLGCDKNLQVRNYHFADDPYVKSSTHAKFIVSDGLRYYLGSGELRNNSMKKNFEAGIMQEGALAADLQKVFLTLFERSDHIPYE